MTAESDISEDNQPPTGDNRVLVIVSNPRDRELLARRLTPRYAVVAADPEEEWPAFDVCLVDTGWFGQVSNRLDRLRSAQTTYLPVLLLVTERQSNEPQFDDALQGPIDDLLAVPARTAHLQSRVDSLLRVRQLSTVLEEERDQFSALTETASDVIISMDEEGIIRYVNPAVQEVFGYDPSELSGKSVTTLMPERFRSRHRKGLERYLEERDRRVDWSGVEFPGLHANGHEVPLEISYAVNSSGDGVRFTGVIRDISSRKAYQERLSVLDRVFRHNVRNRLNVVIGFLSFIIESSDSRNAEFAERALGAAESLYDLTETTRRFQRSIKPGGESVSPTDISVVVEDVVAAVTSESTEARIETRLPNQAWATAPESIPLALEQLIDNAVAATEGVATIKLTVETHGEVVEIAVSDNGPGIPRQIQAILDRGSETPLKHTQGLGLWFVRWGVRNAGGSMEIRENDPEGTTVVLRLPAADVPD